MRSGKSQHQAAGVRQSRTESLWRSVQSVLEVLEGRQLLSGAGTLDLLLADAGSLTESAQGAAIVAQTNPGSAPNGPYGLVLSEDASGAVTASFTDWAT